MKLYPSDTKKQNVNEDIDVIGSIVEVTKEIDGNQCGRISHSDSTWPAKSINNTKILPGEKVKIVDRDNLTWIVTKVTQNIKE